MTTQCPICDSKNTDLHTKVSGFDYIQCFGCDSIFIDPKTIDEIDNGRSLVDYEGSYWEKELKAARVRCYGPALARVAEAFLYARRPIDVFLDVGTGGGLLLDACSTYLPRSKHKFYGIEKYPPAYHMSQNPNLIIGSISDLDMKVDAGCCIEVIEHLTPKMLRTMLVDLAAVSHDDALFIFNSGQPDFVRKDAPGYLDPLRCGHLVSYSLAAISILAEPAGFRVHELVGKTWAFLLEKTESRSPEAVKDRIWTPVKSNLDVLKDADMGSVMYILGLETARAYG